MSIGITTVISAVGRAIISTQISWLPALLSSPTVKRFYPSECGTDIAYDSSSATEIPHQQKLAVRKALSELPADADLVYTYLVTGPFAGGFLGPAKGSFHAGGFDVEGKKATLLGDGKGRVSLTTEKE